MDLLKWLLMLPWRVMRGLAYLLGKALRPLLGDVSWAAPSWMHVLRRNPGKSAVAVAAIVLLSAASWFGWRWYQDRPRPQQMTFQVTAPTVTDYTQKIPVVQPLVVTFRGSAAPIEQVGKQVTQGISTSPAVKGEWKWSDDRMLTFTPTDDWPVGQRYKVHFEPQTLFAPQVDMAKDQFEFSTVAFLAALDRGEFYQDPQQASVKQVIQKIAFNYPVDAAQLEKRVQLAIADKDKKPGAPVKFSVTYDKQKLNAWVHSLPLALPHDPGKVLVQVDKGVTSARGGAGTAEALQGRIGIPGLYSLSVDDIQPTLVDDDKNEPQQVLVVNFNQSVRTADVVSHIHAWALPKHKLGSGDANDEEPSPWDVLEVSDAVLKKSQALALTATPTEQDSEPLQSFRFHAQPGQMVFVRIDKGLQSFGGYVLGQPDIRVVTVPPYPQLLRFVGAGSLLSMSGSKRLSVVSRNLPGIKLEVGRVLPEQLQHLVSLNQGDYSHPQLSYGLGANQLAERYLSLQAVPDNNPAKASYTGVDLGKYLADGKRGVFLLSLAAHDPAAAKRAIAEAARACAAAKQLLAPPTGAPEAVSAAPPAGIPECAPRDEAAGDMNGAPTDSRLIVVTDLGMLAKKAEDGSQDVFVQSIRSGQPV
ncbi:MAG: Ig-like domain-containing protein, partial [Giesbergeria sp.]